MEAKTAVCQYCGNSFEVRFPHNPNKYCSKLCSNRANARPGATNPNAKPRVTISCKTCGKPILTPPSLRNRKKFCSVECRIQYTRTLTRDKRYNFKGGSKPMVCEICGTTVMVRHAFWKRFRACSKRCASEIARRTYPRVSSIEQKMIDAFREAGLDAKPQYPVGSYSVDLAFPPFHLAVECDGDYWHGRAEQKRKDRRKDGYLKHEGWQVLRLSEAEINASPEKCVERVRQFLTPATPSPAQ